MNLDSILELFRIACNPEEYVKYAERNTVGRAKVNGLVVSTLVTKDLGPETAILDKNGTHPVQRYCDKIEAERGHKEWVEKAKTIEKVIKLGYPGADIENEEVTLLRGYEGD